MPPTATVSRKAPDLTNTVSAEESFSALTFEDAVVTRVLRGIDTKGLAVAILDKVVVRLCSEMREEQLVEAFITKHAQSLSERLSKRLVEQLVSDV
jgi:hypothetical protein